MHLLFSKTFSHQQSFKSKRLAVRIHLDFCFLFVTDTTRFCHRKPAPQTFCTCCKQSCAVPRITL